MLLILKTKSQETLSRYSLGVLPINFLKERINVELDLKPTFKPMASKVNCLDMSSFNIPIASMTRNLFLQSEKDSFFMLLK